MSLKAGQAPVASTVFQLPRILPAIGGIGLVCAAAIVASAHAASPSAALLEGSSDLSAAELFKDADLDEGEMLIAEHGCTACHVRNVGGDGMSIYKPTGRISTPGFLRGMVEYCNTELNLQLFPEDVSAVAAVLNRDYYRFK